MKKLAAAAAILTVFAAFAPDPLGAAPVGGDRPPAASQKTPPTQKDLDGAMKYYGRISSAENFTSNDRLAVLLRIKEKYGASGLDTRALDAEIEKQNRLRAAPSAPLEKKPESSVASAPAPSPVEVPKPRAARRLSGLAVTEKSGEFEIIIESDKADSHNTFVLKDPDPSVPPKLVADFYGLTENLPASRKEIVVGSAVLEKIRTAQFEKEPVPVVRLVAYLKKSAKHSLKEIPGGFVLSVAKDETEKGKIVTKFAAEVLSPPPPAAVSASTKTPIVPVAPPAVPSSTAPAASVPDEISSSYKIEPGDVLYVAVTPADEITREVTVNPGGEISLPLAGVVRAAGRTPPRLASDIRAALSKYVTNPDVSVTVRQYARRAVFITGELKGTGGYSYKENMRLLDLISQAGGFTEKADRKNVRILRGEGSGRRTFQVDVEEIARTGDFSRDFLLEPGDIVEVPAGFKKISVLGDVRAPGHFDFKEGMKVVEAVSTAGGFLDTARITEVTILRKDGAETRTIKVNLDGILKGRAADVALFPEDTIYVPKRALSSANWLVTNFLPWLSLISLIIVIRGGI